MIFAVIASRVVGLRLIVWVAQRIVRGVGGNDSDLVVGFGYEAIVGQRRGSIFKWIDHASTAMERIE